MADHSLSSSLQKQHKQTDSSSILSEFAKACRITSKKNFLRALINNNKSSSTNKSSSITDKNSINKDFEKKLSYDLKSIDKCIKYNLPHHNDDDFARINLEHCLLRFQWQSNFSSPMEQRLLSGGIKVLDVGCGSGAWILDMAKEYHHSNTYIGIDILSNFPDEDTRLPNTGFIRCNLVDGIPFPDSTFDFVYERFVVYFGLTDSQWRYLFSEMKRVLKPGGYLEIMEYHLSYDNPGPITQSRNDQVLKYLNSKGIDPETTISSIPQIIRSELSFSDFNKEDRISPIGRWGGEFGLMMLNSYETPRKTLGKKFKLGLTEKEVREFDDYKTKFGNFRCFAQKKVI